MSKLYTWDYPREIEEGKFESRTIFVMAESEEEAKAAVKKKYAKSSDVMLIEKALQRPVTAHSNGDCFIYVTGPSVMP